jgi:hypothetical protein
VDEQTAADCSGDAIVRDTATMISDQVVKEVEAELKTKLGADAQSIYLELQEDGHVLFVRIIPAELGLSENFPEILHVARDVISTKVPPQSGYFSWAAVITDLNLSVKDGVTSEMLDAL